MLESLRPVASSGHTTSGIEATARQLEGVFLARMLAAAGAGQPTEGAHGGIGEAQFSSFLLEAQAQRIADRGGIGLAEMIIRHHSAQQGTDAQ